MLYFIETWVAGRWHQLYDHWFTEDQACGRVIELSLKVTGLKFRFMALDGRIV